MIVVIPLWVLFALKWLVIAIVIGFAAIGAWWCWAFRKGFKISW